MMKAVKPKKSTHPVNPVTQMVMRSLRWLQVKRPFVSATNAQRYLRHYASRAKQPLPIPKLKSQRRLSEEFGFPVVTLSPKNKIPSGVVVLFHGGAYVRPPLADHWHFADHLVSRTQWQVIVPIYPKAPQSTVSETIEKVMPLLKHTLINHSHVVVVGDSAGGGLALALCEVLAHEGHPLPQHLVLLSPWLDIALRNPQTQALEAVDPILGVDGLREIGRIWSGDLRDTDPKVSPLFGLEPTLPPMTLITGTQEIFFPDILAMAKQAETLGLSVDLEIGEGLFHCYPLFAVPEAAPVFEGLVQRLTTIENRR